MKEVEWPKAYREQDTVLLDRILGDDFQMVRDNGDWSNKEKEMQRIKESAPSYDEFRFEIKRLEVHENGTAVVAGTGHVLKDSIKTIYQSSNILIQRKGVWKAILSHVSGVKELGLAKPKAHFSSTLTPDIKSAMAWYASVLKFKTINQAENEARGFKQANMKSGDVYLELIELNGLMTQQNILEQQPRGTRLAGFFKFGIKVDDFDKWMDHFESQNVQFNGSVVTDPLSNKRMVILMDPDGNRIQVFEN